VENKKWKERNAMNIERIEIRILMHDGERIVGAYIKPEKIAALMADNELKPAEVIMEIIDDNYDVTRIASQIKKIDIIVELDNEVLNLKHKTKKGLMRLVNYKDPFRDLILDIINHEKRKPDKSSING